MRSAADALPAWVWVPELGSAGARLTLDDDTAHHVHRVCRARPGDGVTLTDGRGGVASARLEGVRPATVRIERIEQVPGPAPSVLWCGAPEGDRADWLIEKLAELGLVAFQPVETARARWEAFAKRAARWHRLARAALQQSRGAWLLEVRTPQPLDEAVAAAPAGMRGWLADPAGTPAPGRCEAGAWLGAVGPSPGFTPGERDAMVARGFRLIALAERRLRTETAALSLMAWRAAGLAGEPAAPPGGMS